MYSVPTPNGIISVTIFLFIVEYGILPDHGIIVTSVEPEWMKGKFP